MKRKITAIICILATVAGLFAGCGRTAEGTGSDADRSTVPVSAAAVVENEKSTTEESLASEIQDKYSGASEKVTYADGKFEVSRNQSFKVSFTFDAVGIGMSSYDQIAALYSDKDLTKEISSSYKWTDDSHRSYLISPGASPRTAIDQNGLDSSTPGYTEGGRFLFDKGEYNDWGNRGTMYLAQWVDLATGEKLDKPVVTVITVKGELPTPDVHFTATEDGIGKFTWDAVPRASEYMVLEIPTYADGSTGYATVIGQTRERFLRLCQRCRDDACLSVDRDVRRCAFPASC